MQTIKYILLDMALIFVFAGCSLSHTQEKEPMNKNFFAMNTYISFTIYGDLPKSVMDISEAKINELEEENKKLDETISWMHQTIWEMMRERKGLD